MIKIAGLKIDGRVNYVVGDANADIGVFIPNTVKLTDKQILAITQADTLEEIAVEFGVEMGVVAKYHLITWRSFTNFPDGYRFKWQTYRTTDIEDLTQAVLDIANVVGGGENG